MKANRKFINDEEAVSAVIGVILMVAITVAIAATVYVYVSGMLSPTPEAAPSIAWTVDRADKEVTITSGSAGNAYAADEDDANLIFRKGTDEYYVLATSLALTATESGLNEEYIAAGDTITGFETGTYQVIWEPTDKLIGTIDI